MLLPYMCEMVLPQLFVNCGYFCEWQMLLPYLLLVVDDKPLISVLWLVLLPRSCNFFSTDVIAMVADVIPT